MRHQKPQPFPGSKSYFINTHRHAQGWSGCTENGSNQAFLVVFLQFVKTILCQGHLTPLPLYVSPVFWAYDYSLRVYPVPDLLVTADKHDPFTVTNSDCLCINPVRAPEHSNPSSLTPCTELSSHKWVFFPPFPSQGSFPRSGFSFKVFYPSNKTVEDR